MARLKGKKIRTITIEGPLRRESVELRLDDKGNFLAYYNGDCFEEASQAELVKILTEEAKRVQQTTFRRVILVEFEKQFGDHHGYYYGSQDVPDEYIRGFRLTFKVCDVSEQSTDDKNHRLVYDVVENDSGVLERKSQKSMDTWWTGKITVPFTEERYAKLKQAREGIIKLVQMMDEVLGKKAGTDTLAAALDGGRFLPAFKE